MKRRGGTWTVPAVVLVLVMIAVGGFLVYEEFGSKTSLNKGLSNIGKGISLLQSQGSGIDVSGLALIANTFDGSVQLPPTCGTAPANSYITLSNQGGSSGTVQSVTITYGGANNVFRIAGACTVGASGSAESTLDILFPGPSALPNSSVPAASAPFLGTVNLSSGLKVPFSGSFEQGYPRVFVVEQHLIASQLNAPANATCQDSPPATGSYLELTDNGTEGISVSQVGLTWNGSSVSIPVAGACEMEQYGTADASVFVILSGVGPVSSAPSVGSSYTITVLMPNGAAAPITVEASGQFQ